jgi:lactam utilization protein B
VTLTVVLMLLTTLAGVGCGCRGIAIVAVSVSVDIAVGRGIVTGAHRVLRDFVGIIVITAKNVSQRNVSLLSLKLASA